MFATAINNDWDSFFKREMSKQYFTRLKTQLALEYKNFSVLPKSEDVFKAFKLTPLKSVKVVILGQDPYYNKDKSTGLAFSVPKSVKIPPSLLNIFKELNDDLSVPIPDHGCLEGWARQGVLLLNSLLTVREDHPNSHVNLGWESFISNALAEVSSLDQPVVFILWGNNAKAKAGVLTNKNHLVLTGYHPSPLSAKRGFFGCRHFSLANKFLVNNGVEPINWDVNAIIEHKQQFLFV